MHTVGAYLLWCGFGDCAWGVFPPIPCLQTVGAPPPPSLAEAFTLCRRAFSQRSSPRVTVKCSAHPLFAFHACFAGGAGGDPVQFLHLWSTLALAHVSLKEVRVCVRVCEYEVKCCART